MLVFLFVFFVVESFDFDCVAFYGGPMGEVESFAVDKFGYYPLQLKGGNVFAFQG